MDNEQIKQNIRNKNQWTRIIYMVLFAIILYLSMMVVWLVVLVQLLFALITGKPHQDIADFAADLSQYVYRIVAFLTYTSEYRPFPFSDWKSDGSSTEVTHNDSDVN